MRVFDSPGLWYLPDNRTATVAGTLHYSPQRGLLLSLTGTLGEGIFGPVAITYPIIHGVIADSPYGRLVTLVDCFRTNSRFTIPGFVSEEIRANRAYVGTRHLDNEEGADFVSFRANYSHLTEWSNLTGFRRRVLQDAQPGVITARYERPAPLEFPLDEVMRPRLEVNAAASEGHRRFEISEQVELTCSDVAGFAPLAVLRALVSPFQDFLTFAVDTPSTLNEIIFTTKPVEGRNLGDSVHLLFQPVYHTRDERAASAFPDMLFSWPQVEASHPDLLRTWVRFRSEFKAPCDIYFGLVYGPPAYLEIKFLLLVTALSMFLAGRVPNQPILDAIESLRRAVADPGQTLWIDMIPSAEELSLPQATYALMDDYRELVLPAVANDAQQFVTELVDVKRHLFRLSDVTPPRRAMQLRLLQMMERLSLLTKLRILECLGFSRDEIATCVSATNRYLNLVRREGC